MTIMRRMRLLQPNDWVGEEVIRFTIYEIAGEA
jgi:hypothetical protein